jgi:hypothetical protein
MCQSNTGPAKGGGGFFIRDSSAAGTLQSFWARRYYTPCWREDDDAMCQTQPVDARAGRQPDLRRFNSDRTDTPVTPDAVCPPTHPERQILPLPAGVAAGLDEAIRLKNINNEEWATRMTLGMTFLRREMKHTAGNLAMGADAFGGISPDQTMIAYGKGQGGTPGLISGSLTVRTLINCQETFISYNAGSNLGGGWMVFSPDNQCVT